MERTGRGKGEARVSTLSPREMWSGLTHGAQRREQGHSGQGCCQAPQPPAGNDQSDERGNLSLSNYKHF